MTNHPNRKRFPWKVYNGDEYVASLKYAEDAAALIAFLGEDSSIRTGHHEKTIVWHEGSEKFWAGESYDKVAAIVRRRELGIFD